MKKATAILLCSIFSVVFCEGISGVSYFEYRNGDTNQISSITGDPGVHGFFMTRAYLSYDTKVSENVSFKFQSDVHQAFEGTELGWLMYIKNAKLDATYSSGVKITIGLQGMNMFNVQEKTWGYRFVAKSAMDASGWSSSADMGIGISQNFGDFYTSFMYTNGEGYKKLSEDNNMKVSIQVLYGEKRLDKNDGFNVGVVYSTNRTRIPGLLYSPDPSDPYDLDEDVTGVFGGWAGMNARVGFEYDMRNISYSADDMDEQEQRLISFYGSYKLMPSKNLSIMVKYDVLDSNRSSDNDETTTMIAGIAWEAASGFLICPNMVQTKIAGESEDEFVLNFQMKF